MDNHYRLPPYELKAVTVPLSETVDWSHKFLGIEDAWRHTKGAVNGKPLICAVLDTGCDTDHPDLDGAILNAKDFTNSRFGAEDRHDHGTWCCGMIGARAGNNIGIRGIAPECQIIVAKVLGDNGSGSDQSIAAGMQWAWDQGADFFSLSLGGRGMPAYLKDLFQQIVNDGKFIFAASGNDGGPVNDPGAFGSTIGVGSVDKSGVISKFTSRGPQLDILAPGEDMLSTIGDGQFGEMTGTSMATPAACAVGMLAYAKHEQDGSDTDLKNNDQMREHLKRTSVKTGEYGLISPENLMDEHGKPDDATVGNEPTFSIGPLKIKWPVTHEGNTGGFLWIG